MSAADVSPEQEAFRARARQVRQQFEASGTNISEWARARGFPPKLVIEVLRGDRRCIRGASHRAAVALGIKREAPVPASIGSAADRAPAPDGYERIGGARR